MRVISGAGEFELDVDHITTRDGKLVLVGTMGVWEADTEITAAEMAHLLRASLNTPVMGFLARLPLVLVQRRKAKN